MSCKHEDGWVIQDDFVIDSRFGNSDIRVWGTCNTTGCNEKKLFLFDVTEVREIKDE